MTKLRSRLLLTVLLVAMSLGAMGTGRAWARPVVRANVRASSATTTVKPRAPINPFSGDPDVINQTTPKPTQPTTTVISPSDPTMVGMDAMLMAWLSLWYSSRN